MGRLWKLIETGGSFSPLWPISWATDIESTGLIILPSLIGAALLGVAFPNHRWSRILVFLAILAASAFRSSFGLGSINHGNHYWLWASFCFCFLPSGDQQTLGSSLACRYRYLLVFAYSQGLILLFYTMSGFWKIAAGIEALLQSRIGSFHPEGLATIVADKMLQLDKPTLLGPWLVDHSWVGWPVFLFVIYIEVFALWAWLRPPLHRLFGLALACFHVGTFLLLGISFPKHILVIVVLLIWSPFAPDRQNVWETLACLPLFGRLVAGRIRQRPRVMQPGDNVTDITQRGDTV